MPRRGLSARPGYQPRDQAQGGGFAAAGRANQNRELRFLHFEIDTVNQIHGTIALDDLVEYHTGHLISDRSRLGRAAGLRGRRWRGCLALRFSIWSKSPGVIESEAISCSSDPM